MVKYKIYNQAAEIEVFLFGEIGDDFFGNGLSAETLIRDVKKESKGNKKNIRVLINSPGGNIFDGLAIYNFFKGIKDRDVTMEVLGLAASMASIILQAGTMRIAAEGSMVMVHQAHSFVQGTSDEMREEADKLEKIEAQLVDIYSNSMNLSVEGVKELLAEETWFSAEESQKAGLVDSVVPQEKMVALATDRLGSKSQVFLNMNKEKINKFCKNVPSEGLTGTEAAGQSQKDYKVLLNRVDELESRVSKLTQIEKVTPISDLPELVGEELDNYVEAAISAGISQILKDKGVE